EEVGAGADHFDVKLFGADFAYTVDGGELGELQFENFNAASARILFKGRNIHPGHAKNKMVNSITVANEFLAGLPQKETPEHTSGYEGFFHVCSIRGDVENTEVEILIRDFEREGFERRKTILENGVREFSNRLGLSIELEIKDQYSNMREKIEPLHYILDIARQAMQEVDVKPLIVPIRGGTDGARLSFMGLPTPNLFTGGHNFHGRYEYIPVRSMEKAVEVIVRIAELCVDIPKNI
ncbi:MAG: peptidase T, partial [Odoribacter sp.]|nr:peptidase T [Odoribacter sp.]